MDQAGTHSSVSSVKALGPHTHTYTLEPSGRLRKSRSMDCSTRPFWPGQPSPGSDSTYSTWNLGDGETAQPHEWNGSQS